MMEIGSISQEHYWPHLNNLSKARLSKALKKEVFAVIIELTENHPFYLNELCQSLWIEEIQPVMTDVEKA